MRVYAIGVVVVLLVCARPLRIAALKSAVVRAEAQGFTPHAVELELQPGKHEPAD